MKVPMMVVIAVALLAISTVIVAGMWAFVSIFWIDSDDSENALSVITTQAKL